MKAALSAAYKFLQACGFITVLYFAGYGFVAWAEDYVSRLETHMPTVME